MPSRACLPDTRLPSRAEQGLRSTSTRLSRPRGALLTTGALEEPQTAALCNSLWPETLAPSLHLLAGPTHTPEASSLYLSWWYGSLSSKKQRDPKHSLGWGLTARHSPPPFLAAPIPPKTLKQDSRSRFQSHFPHTKTSQC